MRALDFIGVGVGRSGTTWVWNQLKKHPEICTSSNKEAKIFLKNTKGISFALDRYEKCPKKYFVGEYTPIYFQDIEIPEKIKHYCPNAQLLLIFRNPIDRVFTQYKAMQWKHHKGVKETFRDWFNGSNEENETLVTSNEYMTWLPYWKQYFGGQLKINFFDDLTKNPLEFIQGIFSHIGVDNSFVPPNWQKKESKPYNKYYEKNPIAMSEKDRKFVKSYYRQTIEDMQSFLDRDLSHWLK